MAIFISVHYLFMWVDLLGQPVRGDYHLCRVYTEPGGHLFTLN